MSSYDDNIDSPVPENETDNRRSRKNDMLKTFYGLEGMSGQPSSDPLDIDSPHFNAEKYLRKLKQVYM